MNDDDEPRSSFTPGWTESINRKERLALPIKSRDGQIIQVRRQETTNETNELNMMSSITNESIDTSKTGPFYES